jgi:hypothetical protein
VLLLKSAPLCAPGPTTNATPLVVVSARCHHGHLPFPASRNGRAEWPRPLRDRATGDAVAALWIAPGPLCWPCRACDTVPQRDDVRDIVRLLHRPGSSLDQTIIAMVVLGPFLPCLLAMTAESVASCPRPLFNMRSLYHHHHHPHQPHHHLYRPNCPDGTSADQ